VTYAADPSATESVRSAVDAIEKVLHEVLVESHPASFPAPIRNARETKSPERASIEVEE
jgi:hypothetical protein